MANYRQISKFISLILRHQPEAIGISLDEHGWADVKELIQGINKKYHINMQILEQIVSEDEKQRYSFNEDKKNRPWITIGNPCLGILFNICCHR